MWTMGIHGGGQYNDPTYYIILDKNSNRIADIYSLSDAQNIIQAHNREYIEWLEKLAQIQK